MINPIKFLFYSHEYYLVEYGDIIRTGSSLTGGACLGTYNSMYQFLLVSNAHIVIRKKPEFNYN